MGPQTPRTSNERFLEQRLKEALQEIERLRRMEQDVAADYEMYGNAEDAVKHAEVVEVENQRLRAGIKEHIAWHGPIGHGSLRRVLEESQ